MSDVAPVLGVLAGGVAVADTIPYVRDTLRGTTRPHRGTWLIWGVLAVVVCFSQRADGASWSLIMAGAQAVVTGLVFILAIRRGEGGMSAVDAVMIAIAIGGVVGWLLADEPIVATACVVAADLIGAAMMIPKTYRDPHSETLATFSFACVGGALAAGAVGAADLALLLYPIYYCLVNGAISALILHRRGVFARAASAVTERASRDSAHQATAVGDRGRLASRSDLQFPEDVRYMDARRLVADVESLSDLLVASSRRDELENVMLSARERWLLRKLQRPPSRTDVDPRTTREAKDRFQ
jgi:hypothetical protein